MVTSVLVGAGRITLSLDDSRYTPAAVRAVGASRQLHAAWQANAAQAGVVSGTVGDVTRSMRSSLIATIAYAGGVNAVRHALRASVQGYFDYDRRLIAVGKTTGLAREETEALGRAYEKLVTQASSVGRALPTDLDTLFEIGEVGGQAGLTGLTTLREFAEQTALLVSSARDLDPERAAEAVGRLIQNTSSDLLDLRGIVASVTRLGNEFLGGEAAILEQALNITRALSQFRPGAEDILAVATVLEEAGSRAETSSTALLRTFLVLNQATAEFSRNPALLNEIAQASGRDVNELQRSLADGDVFEGLRAITEALTNLRAVVDDPIQLSRSGLLRLLFGGERGAPVRLEQTLGVLTSALPRLQKAFQIVDEELEKPQAAIAETAEAAEAFEKRLDVARKQALAFARDVGEFLVPGLVFLGEQVNVLGTSFVGLGGALAGRAFRNAVRRSNETFANSQTLARAEISRTTRAYELATARRLRDLARVQAVENQLAAISARRATLGAATTIGPGGIPRILGSQNETALLQRQIDLQERLAKSNAVFTASQAAANAAQVQGRAVGLGLARAQTRLLRVKRALHTAYNALGGGFGLTIAAGIGLIGVYRAITREAREQAQALSDIDLALEAIQGRRDAQRYTEAGLLVRDLTEQVAEAQAAYEKAQARLEAAREIDAHLIARTDASGGFQLIQLAGRATDALEYLLDLNRRRIAAINEAEISGFTRDDEAAKQVAAEAELISTRISDAAREARKFAENMRDAHQAAIDRADLEERLAGLTALERRVAELRADDERSIREQRKEIDRQLRDARERLAEAQAIEREAVLQDAALGLSPEQNEARQKNLEKAQAQRQRIEQDIADLLVKQQAAYQNQIDNVLILTRALREVGR